MSLHIVSKANGRWRPGTWFECFDDGCRQVEVETRGNRVHVVKEVGLAFPHEDVFPYVTCVMKRGIVRHGEILNDGK